MARIVGHLCLPRHSAAIVGRLYQTPISLSRRFTEWSRRELSDIDGQLVRARERQRTSQTPYNFSVMIENRRANDPNRRASMPAPNAFGVHRKRPKKILKKVLPCQRRLIRRCEIDINYRRKQHYEITKMFTHRSGSGRVDTHRFYRPKGECDWAQANRLLQFRRYQPSNLSRQQLHRSAGQRFRYRSSCY
jgi:hypothetical protein